MSIRNQRTIRKQLYVISARCRKCKGSMNVALINGDVQINNGRMYGPELFSEKEIKIAEGQGVVIHMQYSATRQESYNANTCKHCGTFIGQHYLFEYFCGAEYGDYQYITIDIA